MKMIAGAGLLRLLEQVANTACADADEHLHEVGARDREERNACLARDRTGQKRLTRTGRPVEQHALRDACTERAEASRRGEELLDLVQLLDRLVSAGDVAEANFGHVRAVALRLALSYAHHARGTAAHAAHQEDPEADDQEERQQEDEDRTESRAAGAFRVEGDAVLLEDALELNLCVGARVVDVGDRLVDEQHVDALIVRLEDDALDLARRAFDQVDELAIGELSLGLVVERARARGDEADRRHDDHDDHNSR